MAEKPRRQFHFNLVLLSVSGWVLVLISIEHTVIRPAAPFTAIFNLLQFMTPSRARHFRLTQKNRNPIRTNNPKHTSWSPSPTFRVCIPKSILFCLSCGETPLLKALPIFDTPANWIKNVKLSNKAKTGVIQ
jgi:hypothetical protein